MRALIWIVTCGVAVGLAACGDNRAAPDETDAAPPIDAEIDGPPLPPDPFEGMFDDPGDFPRGNCRAGALTGFARRGVWTLIGLRTAVNNGALETYTPVFGEDVLTPHTLTDDDLFVRVSRFNPTSGRYSVNAFTVCDVRPDGTLIGSQVFCLGTRCFTPFPFEEPPLTRIAGESEGMGISRLGELSFPGLSMNVRVRDDVAYVANDLGVLYIVSIANPAAPVQLGSYVANGNAYNDVKLIDAAGRRYAVMAGRTVDVIDVTDPRVPVLVAQLPASAHTLFIEGTMVYLADGFSRTLRIFDLTDPRAPVLRSEFEVLGVDEFSSFHDLYVEDRIAYISAAFHGLAIVDCTNPAAPQFVAATELDRLQRYWHSPWRTTVGGRPIVVHGDEGQYSGLDFVDIDPASPTYLQPLGSWHLRDAVSIHNVMAIGARVFVAHYQDGIRILDIADPAAPTQVAYFNTWREETSSAFYFTGALGIDLDPARRRIYVADLKRGLLILEAAPGIFPP